MHRANGRLRTLKLQPKPPGGSTTLDRAKEAVAALDSLATRVRREAA